MAINSEDKLGITAWEDSSLSRPRITGAWGPKLLFPALT